MYKYLTVFAALVLLALTSCKKDDAKSFSDGCKYGASGALGSLGFGIAPEAFQKPCDDGAQKYIGNAPKEVAPAVPEAPAAK